MHGTIFVELQKYVAARLGSKAWSSLVERIGAPRRVYLGNLEYPDREFLDLVTAASIVTGVPVPALLEDFGDFIVPDLIRMFGVLIDRSWRTLDLIEHTEDIIHTAVRLKNPGAKPPALKTHRRSPSEIIIAYASERRLCAVAKGIVKGVGRHYGERIVVTEQTCMLTGGSSCQIVVKAAS